ncbi:MAG: vanadium-dependent haloperoxidase [Phycisphaerales bacterium]|nr:vanadium-dependent haloperoxidase [Phycisphaerales bacterium]
MDLWRPIEGVRNGDLDGNAATQGDANWTPLSYAGNGGGPYTPMFPAYTSGHATMAGAHAAILQAFFGTDDIAFTLSTDDQDAVNADGSPVVFHFQSISEAAMENALSRIWLGVHWRFDSIDGLNTGDQVGDLVAAQLFRQIPAPGAAALLGLSTILVARRRRSA